MVELKLQEQVGAPGGFQALVLGSTIIVCFSREIRHGDGSPLKPAFGSNYLEHTLPNPLPTFVCATITSIPVILTFIHGLTLVL